MVQTGLIRLKVKPLILNIDDMSKLSSQNRTLGGVFTVSVRTFLVYRKIHSTSLVSPGGVSRTGLTRQSDETLLSIPLGLNTT